MVEVLFQCSGRREGDAPGGDPLRDTVDEQVGGVVAAEVAAGERLVILPQPLADLGDRGGEEKRRAVVSTERVLDVAHAEAAGQHLHHKLLPSLAPALQLGPELRAERLVAARDLRRRVFHRPFGRLEPSDTVAVSVAPAGIAAVLVVIPAESVAALRFQRLVDDQPGRKTHQLAEGVRRRQPALDLLRKGLACAHRFGYFLFHGACPSVGAGEKPAGLGFNGSRPLPSYQSKFMTSPCVKSGSVSTWCAPRKADASWSATAEPAFTRVAISWRSVSASVWWTRLTPKRQRRT